MGANQGKCGTTVGVGTACAYAKSTLSSDIEQNLKETCLVPSVCQTMQIGDVKIGNVDCKDIDIGTQTASASDSCTAAMTVMSSANLVQNLSNASSAFVGESANSVVNSDITSVISNTLDTQCGGVPPSQGGGACKSGMTQTMQSKPLEVGLDGTRAKCSDLQAFSQTSNTHSKCMLTQMARADASITNTITNSAKGANWISALMGPLILIGIIILVVIGGGGYAITKMGTGAEHAVGSVGGSPASLMKAAALAGGGGGGDDGWMM